MDSALNFLIIGAQKGGSTLMARGVAQHPDVWMPAKEIPVFRDPLFNPHDLARLQEAMEVDGQGRLCGIKCPDYLARPEVPPRLLASGVRPRLLLCLRDPVARAISAYFWHVRWGLLPIEEPSVGLTRVMDGVYADCDPRVEEIVDWSRYGAHLAHYLKYFDLAEILVLRNEDLRSCPERVFTDIFGFLGVDRKFRPEIERNSVNEGVYSRPRLRFLSLRNRYVHWWDDSHSYVDVRRPERLLPRAASNTVAGVDRYVLSHIFDNERPPIDRAVLDRLRALLRPDLELLESVVGQPFAEWKS